MKLCASSQFPFICLGDCGEVVTGSTPPKANSDFWGGEIPFVTPAQLGFQSPITTADEYVTSEGADRGRLLPEGAVLVCCIGSLGKTGTAGVPLISNQQINAIIFDPIRVDARYGYHVARSLTPLLKHFAPSTTVKIVKKSAFAEFQIPLPSLDQQKRIAGILDSADALRAKRREALDQLDILLQATFLDMFGDPVTNPMGWKMATIGEMTTCLDRLRQPVKEADRVNGDIPYYGANGQQGWINKALFDEPLVLVAEDGGHFGDPARGVAYRIDGPSWVNNHAHVLRPAETIDVEYLHRALRHYDFGPYISGSTRAKLNQTQLNKVRFLLPPLDLQHRFGALVESVEQQKANQRAHLAELDTLFASLQSRAFRGDL